MRFSISWLPAFIGIISTLSNPSQAQQTLVLQPGAIDGKTCEVWDLQPSSNYVSDLLRGNAWTFSGTPGVERGLIQFDLSTIPIYATIQSAFLSLFAPDSPTTEYDSPLSGSNQAWLKRITSAWTETGVTWNNQPTTTTLHKVLLPQSTTAYQDYTNINVTDLVEDMITDPLNSFGFEISLETESYYRRLSFAASDYAVSAKHPKLVITYSMQQKVCEKFCLNFSDPSLNNPTSWLWLFDGGIPATSSDQNPIQICYNVPGTYDVTLITFYPNDTDTLLMPDVVLVNPTPPIPTISQSGNVLTCSTASAYQWQLNLVDIPGATNQTYTILQSGLYSVIVSDSNGCVNSTDIDALFDGINTVAGSGLLIVTPDPVHDEIFIHGADNNELKGLLVQVFSVNGKCLKNQMLTPVGSTCVMDISALPPAMYVLRLKTYRGEQRVLLMKE